MKLRDDVTIYEYAEVLKKRGYDLHPLMKDLLGEPLTTSVPFDWPASFYEQPPKKSFGKFVGPFSGIVEAWGHLHEVASDCKYHCFENGKYYETFTPGLPTDVDADGMPLEAE